MSPHIDVRWLRSFLAIANELSFSRAAQKLRIAQPALTAHIRQLEQAVGASLFTRTNRVSGLTPAGLALIAEAQAIISRTDALSSVVAKAQEGSTGVLRVGIIPPAAIVPVAEALRAFAGKYPGVVISVRQGNQDKLVGKLVAGELDLVVGRSCGGDPHQRLHEKHLFTETQGILLREDDPLAKLATIPVKQLQGRTLLLIRGNIHFGQNIVDLAARAKIDLHVRHAAEDFASLLWSVRAGLGIAPCSLLLSDSLPGGLTVHRLSPSPPKLPIVALWPQAGACVPARHFLGAIIQAEK